MNDIQTVTVYFKVVYGLVAVTLVAYSLYLAREGRRARASLDASSRSLPRADAARGSSRQDLI